MQKPPSTKNHENKERKVGLEIEYAGLPLEQAAGIVHHLFGGKIEKVSDAVFKVEDTEFGNFRLELDAIPLQKIAANTEKLEATAKENLVDDISMHIGRAVSIGSIKRI